MVDEAPSRPGKVILVSNLKGGVGKTSSAVTMAAALAEMGRKSLLIDFDPTPNMSEWFGVPTDGVWPSSWHLLTGEGDPKDCIIRDDHPEIRLPQNVHLIPGSPELVNLREWLLRNQLVILQHTLTKPLAALRGEYDYIWLDLPPAVCDQQAAAMYAADYALLPTIPEKAAVTKLQDAWDGIQTARDNGLEVEVIGIIVGCVRQPPPKLTQHLTKGVAQKYLFADGTSAKFEQDVMLSVTFGEAWTAGQSIFDYDPKHALCDQYRAIAREFEARIAARSGLPLTPQRVDASTRGPSAVPAENQGAVVNE